MLSNAITLFYAVLFSVGVVFLSIVVAVNL